MYVRKETQAPPAVERGPRGESRCDKEVLIISSAL